MNRWRGFLSKEMKHAGIFLMDIVIAFLCLGLVLSIYLAVTSWMEVKSASYSESSFYYSMSGQHYGNMVNMANLNREEGYAKGDGYEEYYAVADYYEAALYYNAFENAGDSERAESWKAKMDEAAARMGTLSSEQQKIDDLLKISL